MKFLITGGAGFIGMYLTRLLLKNGEKVIVFDVNIHAKILEEFSSNENVTLIEGDVLDFDKLVELIRESDAVFHLAAVSRVIPSIEDPLRTFKVNVYATERIAFLCSQMQRKLIFTSSREVYGNTTNFPVTENDKLNPESPYGASKVASESIIISYGKTYGLDYVILRLANVFGLGDQHRVIPTFLERLKSGEEIEIYGSTKVLDFIDVETVARVIAKSFEINKGVYNVSSGKGISLLELAVKLRQILGSKSAIIEKPNRNTEVEFFIGDSSKIEESLDFKLNKDIYNYIIDKMI